MWINMIILQQIKFLKNFTTHPDLILLPTQFLVYRTPALYPSPYQRQYNLDFYVIKLLHLNMRKANSHNFSMLNNYVQPEDQDYLRNIPSSYRNQLQTTKLQTSTSPKVKDNKFSFLQSGNYNIHSRQFELSQRSPKVRDFLRHTTYVSKVEPILDKKKSQLSNSLIGNQFFKAQSFVKYDLSQRNTLSNQSSPLYSGSLKSYGNQKYDKLASKVMNTTTYIEQCKRLQLDKTKTYEPTKYTHYTSQTQNPQDKTTTSFYDIDFKKKINQDFFSPQLQTIPNLEKLKRGYTPNMNIKKVVSPSNKKANIKIQDFIMHDKLGGGKFGTVYKALNVKSRTLYALKKIPKKTIKDNLMVDQFALEVKLQTFLKHQNILQIYGVFDDKEHVYLILEYMIDGTLYSQLKRRKKLPQKQAASKIKQIAQAIIYMHDNGIVHRDIKPQNIVMSGDVCKLCDFGWATICQDRRKTYCGTFDYAAPEILQGVQYDLTVDLWCLGVLSYQLMVGKAPFYHVSRKQTISNILNVDVKKINYPNSMSVNAISFINGLLKKKPEERTNYQDLLKHPFLRQVEESE